MSKRKQPDDECSANDSSRLPGLIPDQIDNEYEHLDDDVDDDGLADAPKMKGEELKQLLKSQMPATMAKDGDIEVTPFNLAEELEEGEFDAAGNFIFKKGNQEEAEGGNDTWAESIDWSEVEKLEKQRKERIGQEAISDQEESMPIVRDQNTCFKEMLRIMRPDETVQRAIKRLGDKIPRRRPCSKSARKKEQSKSTSQSTFDQQEVEEIKRKFDLMIELANERLRDGDTDIYQKTYENLEEAIN